MSGEIKIKLEPILDSDDEGLNSTEPAHHARRPMNAFLIFCKRHRSVVRDRYPSLENRCITKILGEWWAQLEPSQKVCYTELAKQYKEAFLQANPDFKWYKLPAPPLRTLVTRPSNQKSPKLECPMATGGPIVPGKLADESQMGSLSSLMPFSPTSPNNIRPNNTVQATITSSWINTPEGAEEEHQQVSRTDTPESDDKDSGTCTLSPTITNTTFNCLSGNQEEAPTSSTSTLQTSQQKLIDFAVSRSLNSADNAWNLETNNNETILCLSGEGQEDKICDNEKPVRMLEDDSDLDDSSRRKSFRACKGQRYKQFMNSNRNQTQKRIRTQTSTESSGSQTSQKKRRDSESSAASEKTDSVFSEASRGSRDHDEIMSKTMLTQSIDRETIEHVTPKKQRKLSETSEDSYSDPSMRKRFKAADFNLDEKIGALPSLSLEEFQQKKREKKRRSICSPSTPRKSQVTKERPETPQGDWSADDSPNKTPLVGSQKRKARKQQITRVDPNSPHASRDTSVVEPEVLNNMGLTTLAEVASSAKRRLLK